MAVEEGVDSVLLGWHGLITCAQFVVVQRQLNEKVSEKKREREGYRERERE